MARSSSRLFAGLLIIVVGAAGFAYGLVTYNAAHASVAGTLNSVGNSIAKALNGSTPGSIFPNMTTAEQTAAIIMVAGGAVAVIGLLAMLLRGRRR